MKLPQTLSHGLLWFGAAVSLAEMMTGTLFAGMGWGKGIAAVLVGHAIGCVLLFFVGLLSAEMREPTMRVSRLAFGRYGSYAFSIFNIVQLLGWTAIMIMGGSAVLRQTVYLLTGYENGVLWTVLIGLLVAVWIIAGMKNVGKINVFAVGGLFLLTILLSFVVFDGAARPVMDEAMTFGAAVELSIAMPLSWLPLIGDYTRNSERPKRTAVVSAVTYFVGSVWMYIIGMGLALYAGESDIGVVLAAAGFGVAALLIALFSTVTTTFLDAYSAGVSYSNFTDGKGEKGFALIVCSVATVLAVVFPMDQYENFLYLIGSFFVPMVTLLMMEYFVYKQRSLEVVFRWDNAILWGVGFVLYRLFLSVDTVVGSTVPVMVLLAVLSFLCHGITKRMKNKS